MSVRVATLYNDIEQCAVSLEVSLDWGTIGKLSFAARNPDAERRTNGSYKRGTKVYLWNRPYVFTFSIDEAGVLAKSVKEYLTNSRLDTPIVLEHTSGGNMVSSVSFVVSEGDAKPKLVFKRRWNDNSQAPVELVFDFTLETLKLFYKYLSMISNYGMLMIALYQSLVDALKNNSSYQTNDSSSSNSNSNSSSAKKQSAPVDDLLDSDIDLGDL